MNKLKKRLETLGILLLLLFTLLILIIPVTVLFYTCSIAKEKQKIKVLVKEHEARIELKRDSIQRVMDDSMGIERIDGLPFPIFMVPSYKEENANR
jgi:ABC-type Na+ efflux pump permease subunit